MDVVNCNNEGIADELKEEVIQEINTEIAPRIVEQACETVIPEIKTAALYQYFPFKRKVYKSLVNTKPLKNVVIGEQDLVLNIPPGKEESLCLLVTGHFNIETYWDRCKVGIKVGNYVELEDHSQQEIWKSSYDLSRNSRMLYVSNRGCDFAMVAVLKPVQADGILKVSGLVAYDGDPIRTIKVDAEFNYVVVVDENYMKGMVKPHPIPQTQNVTLSNEHIEFDDE
jgi:hypothetical protein